jgi:hypothetical protein
MTDQPEKKGANEDVEADFEGHRLGGPEKLGRHGDISDVKGASDDDTADFEGHRLGGPEKIGKIGKLG